MNNKLKILHVTNIFFTLPYFLGDQLSYFTNKGYDISIVCSPDENFKSFARKHGCKYKAIFVPRTITLRRISICLWRLIEYMRNEKFDIVCGHTPVGGLLAMVSAWFSGVEKRVFFRHGLAYETSIGIKRKLLIAAEKLASRLATQVVCVSPYLIEKSIADGLTNREKMILLNIGSCNGIDAIKKFNRENIDEKYLQYLRHKLGIYKGDFVIGYTGRIVKDKGIEELVTAFNIVNKKYNKSKLLLVGMMEKKDSISTETIEEIATNSKIIHTGLITERIEYYYAMMNVLVLCTHREGFGTSLLEAAAMEVPTLTTNHSGSRDAIVENVTGRYIVMDDAQSIVDKVRDYIENDDLRKRHGRQGRAWVIENFQQELIWKEIERKIYLS